MNQYRYLVIGGGMAASAAVSGIRELDREGTIGVVGMETDPPYKRPYLSKALWKGKPLEKVWLPLDDRLLDRHFGRRIISLDAAAMVARDNEGGLYRADKILLVTGAEPRRLPFGGDDIIYLRTLADYRRLTGETLSGQDFIVIGGGFVGTEIAAALAMNNKKVTMVFPENGIGAAVYPSELSRFLTDYYRSKGVTVLTGEILSRVEKRDGRILVETRGGRQIAADGVIAGIGVQPDAALASSAGLMTGNGIAVDEYLVTSRSGIYAAGDVAEFYNPALGRRLRVEHEDNALQMGRAAGRNMAGAAEPYHYLPYFYSDLFELGYEAVGDMNAGLETITDWEQPYRKGIVYYVRDHRITGVLLWNVWDTVPAARDLITRSNPALTKEPADTRYEGWMIPFRK